MNIDIGLKRSVGDNTIFEDHSNTYRRFSANIADVDEAVEFAQSVIKNSSYYLKEYESALIPPVFTIYLKINRDDIVNEFAENLKDILNKSNFITPSIEVHGFGAYMVKIEFKKGE